MRLELVRINAVNIACTRATVNDRNGTLPQMRLEVVTDVLGIACVFYDM